MITTIKTTKVALAMFEAMKFGIEAEHLGGGLIEINSNYLEKVSRLVEKTGATILSEEDVVPTTPYEQSVNGTTAYDIYRGI
jgi:hypothetical protein